MNREIKFRGKRMNDNKWVYGNLHYNAAECVTQIVEFIEHGPTMSDPCGDQYNTFHNVDHKTIGQFTGLKDKDDKDIYEGDLLNACDDHFAHPKDVIAVKYSGSAFVVYNPSCCKVCKEGGGCICNLDEMGVCIVIGNIFDNPELI